VKEFFSNLKEILLVVVSSNNGGKLEMKRQEKIIKNK
jgi:hypothetical protein